MSDIVERLRVGEACKENGGVCAVMDARSGCLCATAADEITRLRAENERLRAAMETILNKPRDAMASYAQLFAEVCTEIRLALEEKP